jgi:ABC-2 type transport system ATP-binding protein
MNNEFAIETRALRKLYEGDVLAVDGIDLAIPTNSVYALLGPNGAGKTTTISMLTTLIQPSGGTATVAGFDVVRQAAEVRARIGVTFQEIVLDPDLTGREALDFHGRLYNLSHSQREAKIGELLGLIELEEAADRRINTYSGGMKRRLELARGLLHYPKVLFLDEPTIGLDPQTRNRLWEYILELRKREGITIFLTTHYMDEAENADRIAIMDHGKIVALDTPERLKAVVSKDIISVITDDNSRAAEEIKQRYQIEVRSDDNELTFEVARGEKFLPNFIKEFKTRILSVSLRHPSLDDVFLKLTGREIREESNDAFKAMVRQHCRRMRH